MRVPRGTFSRKATDMTLTATSPHSFLTTSGQDIDLFPVSMPSELTVAQAASLLKMSEACVHELLAIDVLEYRQDGERRLINRDKLLEYKEESELGRAWLAEMARENQEMGLYDD